MFDHVNLFLASLPDFLSGAGGGAIFAFALGAVAHGAIAENVLANIRQWHGGIDDPRLDEVLPVRLIPAGSTCTIKKI